MNAKTKSDSKNDAHFTKTRDSELIHARTDFIHSKVDDFTLNNSKANFDSKSTHSKVDSPSALASEFAKLDFDYGTNIDFPDVSEYTDSAVGMSVGTTSSSYIRRTELTLASCSTDLPSSFLHSPSCSHDDVISPGQSKPRNDRCKEQAKRKTKNVPKRVSDTNTRVDSGTEGTLSSIEKTLSSINKTLPETTLQNINKSPTVDKAHSNDRTLGTELTLNTGKTLSTTTLISSIGSSKTSPEVPINVIASIKPIESTRMVPPVGRARKESVRQERVSGIATVSGVELDRQPPPVPARVFASITQETTKKSKRKNYRSSLPQERR